MDLENVFIDSALPDPLLNPTKYAALRILMDVVVCQSYFGKFENSTVCGGAKVITLPR